MNKYLILLLSAGLIFLASCSSEKKEEPEKPATTIEELEEEMKETSEEVISEADSMLTDDSKEETTEETKTDKPAAKAAAGDYTQNPLKGYVVSIKDAAFGADGKINKDQAKALLDKGYTIGVKSGNNVYVVYHENGSYAGEKIHNYANRGTVGLYGKAKTKNGVNAFIVTRIVSLD